MLVGSVCACTALETFIQLFCHGPWCLRKEKRCAVLDPGPDEAKLPIATIAGASQAGSPEEEAGRAACGSGRAPWARRCFPAQAVSLLSSWARWLAAPGLSRRETQILRQVLASLHLVNKDASPGIMPSAFEGVVRSVVQELDHRGDLIPVDSLRNSTSFRPYCLLSRKHPSSWFWKPRYTCVNLSIKDILEPDVPEPELECGGPFHFFDAVDGKVQGSVELAAPGQGKISGGATVSGSSSASMNVCTLRVAPNTWETMHQERRLRQPEHKVLQQLRSRRDDVFVVTEVLQTQEEVQVTRTHKQEGSGQFALPGAMCLQGEGEGHLSQKKMVTIPAGSILAFRVSQLLIGSNWDILLFPDEKKRTFQLPSTGHENADGQRQHTFNLLSTLRSIHERLRFLSDGTPEDRVVSEDFQGLRVEVEAGSSELKHLEMELKQQLLVNIERLLQDLPSLEALEASLEQGLCSGGQVELLDGPAGNILQCLVLPSGELVPQLAAPVFYLLGALTVLNETQHQLLAKALETRVLSGQLELVEHLLEQSTPWQEQSAVTLSPRLLGGSWDEEAPAWVLLEECGLELQMDAPQVHWEPKAQGPTCALYAALALLAGLSQEPC